MTPIRDESNVVGIDLGTTNSAVSIWDEGKRHPTLISNFNNELVTPSVVAMQDGEIIVGSPAKSILMALTSGDEAVPTHKRDMGTQTLVPFNGKKVPPYILGSYILESLKRHAEDDLGTPVDRAVITVPAYFTQAAVEDTKQAGEKAGFLVEALLPEPTAAALAFGHRAQEKSKLMVYDLGGGTFDVSIIEAIENQFVVRVNDGNRYLGGDDFDILVRDHILSESGSGYLLESDHPRDKIALQGLLLVAEQAKIRLSNFKEMRILNRKFVDGDNRPITIDLTLTRDAFQELIKPKIDETIACCRRALGKAQLDIEEIKDILLVGGSTKIPCVAARIEKEFGIAPNPKQLNPMICVAEGAAIHTRSLRWILKGTKLCLEAPRKPSLPRGQKSVTVMGKLRPQEGYEDQIDLTGALVRLSGEGEIEMEKAINPTGGFVIRTELQGEIENDFQLTISDSQGRELEQFHFALEASQIIRLDNVIPYAFSVGLVGQTKIAVLLKEQSTLPAETTETFAVGLDGQTELVIPIYEGIDPLPERNRLLGEVRIESLPSNLKRGDEVHVTFQMDQDRILHVRVEVPNAHAEQDETINVSVRRRGHADSVGVEDPDQENVLAELSEKLTGVKGDLDKKRPLVPETQRGSIGEQEARLCQEADDALRNREFGQLEAKIEELVNLHQEVSEMIPDIGLVEKFWEDANTAMRLGRHPEVKSVDLSTVEEAIGAGEAAINAGDSEELRKQHGAIENLLNRMYEDIGASISDSEMLASMMQQFEVYKQQISRLEARAEEVAPDPANAVAEKGIIERSELGMDAPGTQRPRQELQNELQILIVQGETLMQQAPPVLQSRNEREIQQLGSQFGFLLSKIKGLMNELYGESQLVYFS